LKLNEKLKNGRDDLPNEKTLPTVMPMIRAAIKTKIPILFI
jgi:hypothetical protein